MSIARNANPHIEKHTKYTYDMLSMYTNAYKIQIFSSLTNSKIVNYLHTSNKAKQVSKRFKIEWKSLSLNIQFFKVVFSYLDLHNVLYICSNRRVEVSKYNYYLKYVQ